MGIFNRIKDFVRFGAAIAKTRTPDKVDRQIDKATEIIDAAAEVESTVEKVLPKPRKPKTGDGR